MYEIDKLKNYFGIKDFYDAHFQNAYETLKFDDPRQKCNQKYLKLFRILKKTHVKMVRRLNKKDFEKGQFSVQQVAMGSFTLGLENVATYVRNIECAIAHEEYDRAIMLFERYQKHNVFENAENAINRYIASLPKCFSE